MQCKSLDSRACDELKSLNAGLMRILTRYDAAERVAAIGLSPSISTQLTGLTPEELDFIASAPVLLAGFEAPVSFDASARVTDAAKPCEPYSPGLASGSWADAADHPAFDRTTDPWSRMTRLFAASLLTWLWKLDRSDQLLAALCFGSGQAQPVLSVPLIEAFAGHATRRLRVRFGDHTRFWPDLIRAARSHDGDLRALAHLAVLPLALADDRPAGKIDT